MNDVEYLRAEERMETMGGSKDVTEGFLSSKSDACEEQDIKRTIVV